MAESIVRLRVNSDEYDNKLKRASEALNRYADGCRKAGGTLEHVDDGVLEFTRSLGKMETTATTAKGKLNEMTKAFTDLSVQYKNMTDQEKNGEFGKAINASLGELKGRIQESRAQLDDVNKTLNGGGGLGGTLDSIASKFGVNIDQLTKFGSILGATSAALKVAKDAFFASETNVDEWGRTVASSESIYEGFLSAINNGDISGYLGRIDQIVKAAREAYNELDKLGTMRTIQGPQFSKQEAENTRMRMMIMTGKYIAPAAGSGMKAAMAEGTVLTPAQIRSIEQKLENGMKSIGVLTKNELQQTGKAIDAYYNKLAVTNGMSRSEFRLGTSSWDEFSRRMQGYEDYKRWDAQARAEFARQGGRGYVDFDKNNPYAEYRKWGTFRVDKMGQNSYNDLVGLIKQQQQQTSQLYSQIGQTYRTINRAEGITVRGIMGGGSGGGGGRSGGGGAGFNADSIAFNVPDVEKLDEDRNFISGFASLTEEAKKQMLGLADATEDLGGALAKIGEASVMKEMNDRIANQVAEVQKTKKAWSETGQAIGMVGNMMGSIKDPAAQTAGAVAQAIANIALAYSQALGEDGTIKSNIWYFIAASAAAMVSMATTISQIHSATGYAEGGIVKGNSYSGDNMMFGGDGLYGLNAGELVLTRAQQNSLAGQLEGSGVGNLNLQGILQGENILIAVDRTLQRQGRELAVWGRG